MDRVAILGLMAALACACTSPALGQLGPVGPAPAAELPGAQHSPRRGAQHADATARGDPHGTASPSGNASSSQWPWFRGP